MFSAFSQAATGLPRQRTHSWLGAAGIVLCAVFIAVYGYTSLTRIHDFPNDPMNYVDVARNIAAGKGAVQSTAGFNQQLFAAGDPLPTPLTSQPILYPLVLSLPGVLGLPIDAAALLLSTLCFAATVLLAYTLALSMYGRSVALLCAGMLLLYFPLRDVMRTAFSESIGIVLVLASLALLDRYLAQQRAAGWAIAAGLCGGLAFASRYALVIAPLVAGVFVLLKQRRAGLPTLVWFGLGCSVPVGLTIARNLVLLGTVLPTPPASTRAWSTVVLDAIKSLLGRYTDLVAPNAAAVLLIAASTGTIVWALRRHELRASLLDVLLAGNRGLLTLWAGGYLAFMVYQRSRFHFDPLNARLLMPAGVVLVLLWAAFALRVLQPRPASVRWAALALAALACGHELWIAGTVAAYSQARYVAGSERLQWVERNTNEHDLLIGDETVDLPFYFRRPLVVSFAHVPYNEPPQYEGTMRFVQQHCGDYRRTFLLIRDKYEQPQAWQQNYGSMIADLVAGRTAPYPGIVLEQRLADAWVFSVSCDA